VYVAGPISKGDQRENLLKGIEAALHLVGAGYSVYSPHALSSFEQPPAVGSPAYENLLANDFSWVEVCDALLRLEGESAGADREIAFARAHGIPVYDSVHDLLTDLPPVSAT
jgi:hypothetical protein